MSVLVTKDTTLFVYTVHLDKETLPPDTAIGIKSALRDQGISQICRTPGTVLLSMLFGKDVLRSYKYENGELFFKVRVTWADCGTAP
jgi:hypothetical protein